MAGAALSDALARLTGSALVWRGVQLVGGRGLSLARILVLAALLAPDAFGLVAVAIVALDIGLAVTQLGAAEELVQRATVDRRHYDTAWTLGLVRGVVLGAMLAAAAPAIAGLFDQPDAVPLIRVLGLKPLLDALASVRIADLTRELRFRALAGLEVAVAAVELAVALGLVLAQRGGIDGAVVTGTDGAWAIVGGAFAGAAARVALSYVLAPHRPRAALGRTEFWSLFRFGRWVFATHVIALVGTVALRAVVARRLGAAELGVFYLALRLAAQPNELIGDSVRAVAFPVVARVRADLERVARTFRAMLGGMFLVLTPVYATLAVLAGTLTGVLGDRWEGLTAALVILAIDGVADVPADAAKPLVLGLGIPARQTLMRAIRTVVILALAWPFTGWWGVAGAAAAYLAAEVVQTVAAAVIAAREVPRPFAGVPARLGGVAVVAAAAAAGAGLAVAALDGIAALAAGGVAAAAAAVAALVVLDRRFGAGLSSDLARAFPAAAGRLGLVPGGVE